MALNKKNCVSSYVIVIPQSMKNLTEKCENQFN